MNVHGGPGTQARMHLRTLAPVGVALFATIAFACSEDGSAGGNDGGAEADSPSMPSPISDGSFTPRDAETVDASDADAATGADASDAAADADASDGAVVDASDGAVAPTGVTVTVVDVLAPRPNVRVIAHDATGAVVGEMTTDAAGKVVFATAPSMVTVLVKQASGTNGAMTYMDLVDGTVLRVVVPLLVQTTVGQFSVAFDSIPAGSTVFDVRTNGGCGATVAANSPINFGLQERCAAPVVAIVAFATGPGSVTPFGAAFAKNVAPPANGATANVGPLVWSAPGTTTISVLNPPADLLDASSTLDAVVDGVGYAQKVTTASRTGHTFATITGFAQQYRVDVIASSTNSPPGVSRSKRIRQTSATAAPASETLPSVDFATTLPNLTNLTLDQTEYARPVITVTAAGSLAAATSASASLRWLSGLPSDPSHTWTLVFSPSKTVIRPPALPADAAAFAPTSTRIAKAGASYTQEVGSSMNQTSRSQL